MQLIEIIQIVLLIFIALSGIIFLFSYLGYRSKSKLKGIPKTVVEVKKVVIEEPKVAEYTDTDHQAKTQVEPVQQNPRFEVFNPNQIDKVFIKSSKLKDKNIHTPHTLFIKK